MAKKRSPLPESPTPDLTPPLRLEWRSPAELAENPRNWRTHPAEQLGALTDVLSEVGWAGACLYNEETNRLIDGHARRKVALEQGAEKIPVLVGKWSPEQEAKILATLDPLAAMAVADKGRLDALLRDVSTGSESLQQMLTDLAEKAALIPSMDSLTNGAPVPGDAEAEELDYGEEAEDSLDLIFKAPYPWFGGKSRVAKMVWKRFGQIQNYIEPFFGSGAVFLNRPQPFDGTETINDFDGMVANFWRAVQADPEAVAKFADWPVIENDLAARHAWLVSKKDTLQAKLEGDPDYFDPKIAGWWCWGMACWIGGEFCSGKGPWQVVEAEDGTRQLVHLGNEGRGVNRQLVHLGNEGRGVNRKRVHLGNEGQGVNRKRVHLGNEGQAGLGERGLLAWMQALSERLRRVRVCCGDWTRVCGGRSGDSIRHFFAGGNSCGIFLDPPYAAEAGRDDTIYAKEDLQVAHAVREWAISHGDDERLRIALCGYDGEHQMPASWKCVKWKAHGGYAMLSADGRGQENKHRERIWFSPHCLTT